MNRKFGVWPALAFLVLLPGMAAAQRSPARPLRVFVDCGRSCDMDYLRTEVDWVDYMRDRADADVHVLVTDQGTGGGGSEYTLSFIGLREFAGRIDTLSYIASSQDTDDLVRRGLTQTMALGLVPFAARTPYRRQLEVRRVAPGGSADSRGDSAVEQDDPWNYWTFRVGLNGYSDGESNRSDYRVGGSVSANRTTSQWKVNLGVNGNYSEQEFTFESEDTTILSINRSASFSTLITRSLGPHLSAGLRASASTSTYGNTALSWSFRPAVEYNVFDYGESTRRVLVVEYSAGVRAFDYRELTIYEEMAELLPVHELGIGYGTRQPWGEVDLGITGSQYLHDSGFFSLNLDAGVSDIRLFKGLSLSFFGNYRMVRDQLSLPQEGATPDEVLLRQKEIATDYRYHMNFGIGYRFGSIFNNVVNPRMNGGF